jgi:ankyrin repeat protein
MKHKQTNWIVAHAFVPGNYDAAELLLSKNADVESVWEFKTPLHIAAQHGNARMMILLLQNEANVIISFCPSLVSGPSNPS